MGGAYWNPVGLAQLQRKEFTTMQASLFQGTKLTYTSFAWPTKSGSTFAIHMTQLANPGFEQVDVTINPATNEPSCPSSSSSATRCASSRSACRFSRLESVTGLTYTHK